MAITIDLPLRMARGGGFFLCRFLTELWRLHTARAAYRRSLHDLRDLNDHLLADVGLTTADQRRGHPPASP